MVGGSRLGPAVLPCQHARRPRAGGRRRGVRDGRARACLRLWLGRSSQPVGGSGRAKRSCGGGAWREPRGAERGLALGLPRPPPSAGRARSSPKTKARGPLASARGRLGESDARSRRDSAAGSALLRPTCGNSGCAREGSPDAFVPEILPIHPP